jgi:hypothetical protein
VISRTTPTSKFTQLNPSEFTKHLRTGSVQIPRHILTIRMKLWGFFKSSASYLSVHIELSICLRFYLRCSLGGYTVGTNMEFPVEVKEALAP